MGVHGSNGFPWFCGDELNCLVLSRYETLPSWKFSIGILLVDESLPNMPGKRVEVLCQTETKHFEWRVFSFFFTFCPFLPDDCIYILSWLALTVGIDR